jgi:uncharacterized protein YlxW (UPF0749 family)
MVKTHKNSRFVLLSLADIRSSESVILQIEDTSSKFENGHKCYLCEVVSTVMYYSDKDERQLIKEICELNNEKRKLEKKIVRLENKIEKQRKEYESNE